MNFVIGKSILPLNCFQERLNFRIFVKIIQTIPLARKYIQTKNNVDPRSDCTFAQSDLDLRFPPPPHTHTQKKKAFVLLLQPMG